MAGQDMVGVVQSVKGKKAQVAFGQILTTVDQKLLTVVSNNEYREAMRPQTARTVVSVDSRPASSISKTISTCGACAPPRRWTPCRTLSTTP